MTLKIANYKYLNPFSEPALRRFCGKGPLYDFLLRFAVEDVVYLFDDFFWEALDQTNGLWIKKTDTGTAEINPDQPGGQVRLTVSATDDKYGGFAGQLAWAGDQNCGMMARLYPSAVTNLKVEVGFTDAQNDAGAVNVLATPSSTAADYAVCVMDTHDATDGTKWHLATDGSTTNMNATATVTTKTFAATTWTTIGVLTEGNVAHLYVDKANLANHGAATASQFEGATALCPWVFAQARAGSADKNIDFDWIAVWQDRA